MRNLRKAEVRGKRVLVRVDFNVSLIGRGERRIEKTLPTLRYLLGKGAKLVLATHMEKNDGIRPSTKKLSEFLRKTYFRREKNLEILENLRWNPGEENCSLGFAKRLARGADLYVNEAFAASHRRHASIVLLPRLLPSYCGFLFENEIKNISKVFRPPHPFTFILGGGKVETKLPILKSLLPRADRVLVGGKLLDLFALGKKPPPSKKIILPKEIIVLRKKVVDVGPGSFEEWARVIKESKLVVWNGPLGYIEKGFNGGTKKLISILKKTRAEVIIGGGDTLDFLPQTLPKNIFVSTGGGAMLEYLAKGTLPGMRALEIRN